MKLFGRVFLVSILAASLRVAEASPLEVSQVLPSAQRVGEAHYRVLAWTVFEAALWADGGVFSWDRPFALTLTYRRSFSAQALTNRTLGEMSRRSASNAETLAPLRERLHACFPDVTPGDRITGVSTGANSARFYFNGRQRCEIEWPGFRRGFFGIWLDANGVERAQSARLRGSS